MNKGLTLAEFMFAVSVIGALILVFLSFLVEIGQKNQSLFIGCDETEEILENNVKN